MAKILIPTRNRSSSLASVLCFLDQFHPGTEVIIADGSEDSYAETNKQFCASPERKAQVEYRRYPYDMPFFDRILDVLGSLSDDYIIMGSDDDYPVLDALDRAEAKLRKQPGAATALGATLKISLRTMDEVAIGMSVSRPLPAKNALSRANHFSFNSFSTTYAVTRRDHLIERYERAKQVFLPGFFDFGVGVHDALAGPMVSVPEFTYIATRNFNHSYLRQSERFEFLKKYDAFETLRGNIQRDLERYADQSSPDAKRISETLMRRRIVQLMGGVNLVGGKPSNLRDDKVVDAQVAAYFDLFDTASPLRETLLPRLRYVIDGLKEVALSSDNDNEAATVDSLEAQQAKVENAEAQSMMFTSRMRLGAELADNPDVIPTNVAVDLNSLQFSDCPIVAPAAPATPAAQPAAGGGLVSKVLGRLTRGR